MTSRALAWLAVGTSWVLHTIAAVWMVATLDQPFDSWGGRGGTVALGFMLAGVTAVLTLRRPDNRLGWMLATAGVFLGINTAGVYYHHVLVERGAGWSGAVPGVINALWAPGIMLIILAFASFPDGRLPTGWPRRVVASLFIVTVVSVTTAVATTETTLGVAPLGAAVPDDEVGALFLPMPLYVLAALATMIARFRRSTGLARQQFRWVAYAFALYLITTAVQLFLPGRWFEIGAALSVATMGLLFAAFAVAILRYRLYDLDRIVSRTATYAALTAILLAVYAGAVLLFGSVARAVTEDASSPVVIALSTLVAAAVFDPLRRRLQAAIDRRLNRERYDARAEVERLGGRLVDEVDRRAIEEHVVAVIARTVQPAAVALWAPGNTTVTATAYTGER